MTSRDFCYWLQGYFELHAPARIDEKETKIIQQHLSLVFKHEIDPSIDLGDPAKAAELQKIHDAIKVAPPAGNQPLYRC